MPTKTRISLFLFILFAAYMVAASGCAALDAIGPAGDCVTVQDTSYAIGRGPSGKLDTMAVFVQPRTHCR